MRKCVSGSGDTLHGRVCRIARDPIESMLESIWPRFWGVDTLKQDLTPKLCL